MLERTVMQRFLKQLESLHTGHLTVITPDGKRYIFEGQVETDLCAEIRVLNIRAIYNLKAKGDVGFAESYRDRDFDTPDLAALLTLAAKNSDILESYFYGSFFGNVAAQLLYYLRSNTLNGSRRNIHAHYDLGNEFYRLWLDESMSYSSALYHNPNESLLAAQGNKYDRLVDCLDKRSGSLLEVGCGWGGFAEHVLKRGDYEVKAITISQEQHNFATQRLNGAAQIALEDYRIQQGKYDNIVSIEMFEAVGERFWPTYFHKMKSLLNDRGRAVIQTITIDEPYFKRYRQTGDMIRSYIFPGGMLPSVTRFTQEASRVDLQVENVFAFGQDYATTLRHWLHRFDTQLEAIYRLGFDDAFVRIWRFYLALCIASFSVGRTNVVQVELSHA